MTLQELSDVLAGKTVAGTLTLKPGDLTSADVDALLAANFPDATLAVSSAATQRGDAQITVSGSATLFGTSGFEATAVFSVNGSGAAEVVMTAKLASYCFAPGFSDYADGVLADLTFANAQFTLASQTAGAVTAGVSFAGDYQLPAALQAIADLLKVSAAVRFSGPLAWVSGKPQLALASAVFSGVALVHTKADMSLLAGSDIVPLPKGGQAIVRPYLRLRADLVVTRASGPATTITLTADLAPSGDQPYTFTSRLTNFTLDSLADLASFAGGSDLALPSSVPGGSLLALTQLTMVLSPAAKIVSVGAQVASTTKWDIVSGEFSVDAFAVSFTVNDPLAALGGRQVFTTISGTLDVHDAVKLDLTYALPGNTLNARLVEGSVIPLSSLLASYLTAPGLPELDVVALELGLDIAAHDFQFETEIDGQWPVQAGGASPLQLDELLLYLSRTAGAVTARIFTALTIAGVQVQVSADFQTDQGWNFAGGTRGQPSIPLNDLVNDAGSLFGLTLPTNAPQATLTNIQMTLATQNKDFSFACDGTISVLDENVDLGVYIARTSTGATSTTTTFHGYLTIDGQQFTADFASSPADKSVKFTWKDAGTPLGFKAVAAFFHYDLPDLPEGLDLALTDAEVYYDFDKKEVVASATSKHYGQILFASLTLPAVGSAPGQRVYLFSLDVPLSLELSGLPLIGSKLPANLRLGIPDLQVVVASAALTADNLGLLNSLITNTLGDKGLIPVTLDEGFTFAAVLDMGGDTQPIVIPLTGGTAKQSAQTAPPADATPTSPTAPGKGGATTAAAPAADASPSADDAKWFKVQKTCGPVSFKSVGVRYADQTLWFLLEADLSAAGLTLSLSGLGVGSPLTHFSPEFHLDGLGISYRNGPVEIAGAFLHKKVTPAPPAAPYDEYDGAASVSTAELTLSALGSYALPDGHPSLFVYAILDYPLGGPAFFFVTGLAAGFGYNRALTIPSVDKVADFPLVADAVAGAQAGLPTDIAGALARLDQYIPVSVGESFLAVGVKFTSFKLIDAFVLVTVEFGTKFEADLLGLATLIVPTPVEGETVVTPLAEVQIALRATYAPDEGCLEVDARLTSASYLLSKDCHLTGGFAFYSWFTGEHAGDFVSTLGGYHPKFDAPAYYPTVPRLAINWRVDDELSIKGDAYYALTSHALMAGAHLDATWQSGSLSAYFKAGADFLIAWKPYHYDAEVSLEMGVSYTFHLFGSHTISVSVDADLHLWGPEFAGTAHIDIKVVSFDVSFGSSSSQTPSPIDWPTFKKSFLPGTGSPCGVSVKDGLVTGGSAAATADATKLGVLNARDFWLVVNSVVPFTEASVNLSSNPDALGQAGAAIGIGSMGLDHTGVRSALALAITAADGTSAAADFKLTPILKRVPAGLWGETLTPAVNGTQFVEGAACGFDLVPAAEPKPGQTATLSVGPLLYDATTGASYGWNPAPERFQADTSPATSSLSVRITDQATTAARNALLGGLGLDTGAIRFPNADFAFLDAPQEGTLAPQPAV